MDTARPIALFALLFVILCVPLSAQPGPADPDARKVYLKIGTFDPLVDRIPEHPGLPSVANYERGVRGAYLVQFDHAIGDADRSAIENAGGSIKGYVAMMTLEVVMSERERTAVQRLAGVRWVSVYQPSFKISAELLQQASNPTTRLLLQVSLFPGEGNAGANAIVGMGGQVRRIDRGRSFEVAEVEIPAARLPGLARLPLVRYIEPVYRPMLLNDRSRFLTGLTDIANDTFTSGLDPSLDGYHEGSLFRVKYGLFDNGVYTSHPDFASSTITLENGIAGADQAHGTHTAGSLVGNGSQSTGIPQAPPGSGGIAPNRFRGITPQAALHHISFDTGYGDRQIFERESEVGAQISSNSWGWCSGFFCTPITNYNTNAATWDAGVWDADDDQPGQQPLVVFFAAGNSGNGNSSGCGGSGDQIGSPGTAKNVITVGASETDRGCGVDSNNPGEVTYFSSRGPVDPNNGKGLFKPEVVNVGGMHVLSLESPGSGGTGRDAPSSCSDTGQYYRYEAGTSMSTPLTAGLGGAVYQDLVVNRGVASPKPSLIKALLVNGAVDLTPGGGCDYTFDVNQSSILLGWGRANARNSMYGPGGSPSQRNVNFENEVTENAVATNETYTRQVTVNAGTPFKVSLAWTDYPAAAGATSPLVVNDLDLEVVDPNNTTYRGNNFTGNWSTSGGSADRYNVVENVYIQNPIAGSYTIRVKGFQVSQDQEPGKSGTNQDFSLVWSGSFGSVPPPPSPPSAPSGLAATPASPTQVDLVWTQTSDNEDGFKLERCTGSTATCDANPGLFAQFAQVSANVTNYSDTGRSPNTTYAYRLRAFNAGGNSAYSNTDDATTPPLPLPADPSSLTATAVSASQINLAWTQNSNNEDGFKIERCMGTQAFCDGNPASFSQIAQVGVDVTNYSSTGLAASTTYSHRVRAYNGSGNSGYTNTASATTFAPPPPPPPPAPPSNLTAVAGKNGPNRYADLTWTDNSNNNADTFRIERCTGSGCTNFAEVGYQNGDRTTFRNVGLARRATYRYRIRAQNAGGYSPYSNEVQITTQ